jgi:glycosyltransferase involved in cell wall biosynthesis
VTTSGVTSPPAAIDQAAYDNYLRVRDEVLRMQAAIRAGRESAAGEAAPSRYWTEELTNIDYMIEASPLIIRKLRQHAFHITNLRPYHYRDFADRQAYFERRMQALTALGGGTDLLVPEAEALGGFGYSIGGHLYNVDTLKFFEVFVGMRRAGILDAFSPASDRRLVWEIGGGWGGFAYQFKTLFPHTTYVIVDFPELFLFSATYLSTMFPQATLRYWREGQPVLDDWQQADFVFIPVDRADAIREASPDLLVNLVSFQEMRSGQVEAYAGLAAAAACPALYSLNRDRSHYNDEIDSVGHILSHYYDLREIRLLGSDYTRAIKKDSALTVEEAAARTDPAPERYRHLVGSLRTAKAPLPALAASAASAGKKGATPLVGIGLTLHNRAGYLCEALDSLLAQSYPDFKLVLADDASTDGTEAIARAYAQRDSRVHYVRFEKRRGMVAVWRAAFEHATSEGATYFAWASDHDRWHPEWLERLVGELERHPDAVLAYPMTERMDVAGMPLPKVSRQFQTAGVRDLGERWRQFSRSDAVAAGDMVYGLMRTDAGRRAGIFREVLCPDRLLLAELTLQGQIRQVPEVLWFRRQFSVGSVARQRGTLFAPDAPRPGPLTPPWYMHARALWNTYGSDQAIPGLRRTAIARLVASYTASYAARHYLKSQHDDISIVGLPRWLYKRAKHGALLAIHKGLVVARRAGLTPWLERTCERLIGRSRPWRKTA